MNLKRLKDYLEDRGVLGKDSFLEALIDEAIRYGASSARGHRALVTLADNLKRMGDQTAAKAVEEAI